MADLTDEEIDNIKERIHDIQGKIAEEARNALNAKTPEEKKKYDDIVENLKKNIEDLASRIPVKGSAGAPKRLRIPKIGMSEDELIKARNKLRTEKGLPLLKTAQEKKDELDEKLKKAQLKAIQKTTKPLQPILRSPNVSRVRFKFPQFAVDNATGIVIAELIVLIIFQIHAGTKFVSLWNYAFSPNTTTPINPPNAAQIHGSNNPSVSASIPVSVVPKVDTGAGLLESWGVPKEFQYSGGYDW